MLTAGRLRCLLPGQAPRNPDSDFLRGWCLHPQGVDYQLAKCLGVQASALHNFDISAREYRFNKLILGTDCEKVLDAGFTGLNTRAGDLMTVKFDMNKTTGTADLALRKPDRIHIVLHSDQILEIRDSGCQVYD